MQNERAATVLLETLLGESVSSLNPAAPTPPNTIRNQREDS